MVATHAAMIKAIITAYSTAVGPPSSYKNWTTGRLIFRMVNSRSLLEEKEPGAGTEQVTALLRSGKFNAGTLAYRLALVNRPFDDLQLTHILPNGMSANLQRLS
jgi:hypothetical protein